MRGWMPFGLVLTMAVTLGMTGRVYAHVHTTLDDTTHVREISKCKAPVLIVASGEGVLALAQQLEVQIKRSVDWKRKDEDCRIVTPTEAATLLDAKNAGRTTVIYLLCGKDLKKTPLPDSVAHLLPFNVAITTGYDSVGQSAFLRKNAGDLVFNVALYAPDTERLRRLFESFLSRRENFRNLAYEERHKTNRVAIFRNPDHASLTDTSWGRFVSRGVAQGVLWEEIKTYSLTERDALTAEQLEEFQEVYVLNRSKNDAAPEAIAKLLEPLDLKINNVALVQDTKPDQTRRVVLSVPNTPILETRLSRYRNVDSLAQAPPLEELRDLRGIGSTALIIPSRAGVTTELAANLHPLIADRMRKQLRVEIKLNDKDTSALNQQITVESLLGSVDAAKKLRQKYGSKFVWLCSISQLEGAVNYSFEQTKLRPETPTFRRSRPDEPVRERKESSEDYSRRYQQYRKNLDSYLEEKSKYDDEMNNTVCEWKQTITQTPVARTRAVLQLVDLETPDGAKVVWSRECSAAPSFAPEVFRTQLATVRGFLQKPEPLQTPENLPSCPPEKLVVAVEEAINEAVATLRAEALLPDGTLPLPVTAPKVAERAPEKTEREPAETPPTGPIVADIDGKIVTVNIGKKQNVKVGDKIYVVLKTKEVVDPTTGKVILSKILDVAAFKVTEVSDQAAECVPATPQDLAKLSQVKKLMAVKHEEVKKKP